MSIDVFGETVVSFAEAAKRLPKLRSGKPIHVSVLYRWAQGGRRSQDGQIVRLETIKVGGTTCTSLEALQQFFDRLSGPMPVSMPPRRTNRQRLRDIKRANEELERAGW